MTGLAGGVRTFCTRLRVDPLVRNSFFLMATTGLTATLGFVFWLVVARLYPVQEVGPATSLLAALALLPYVSLMGMGSSLIRRLPTSERRSEHVSTTLITVSFSAAFVALIFMGVIRFASPELAFVTSSWVNVGLFVFLAMFTALNLLMSSVFVALRSAKYNLLINGVLMSATKIALPFLFVWAGAIGIFAASGLASGVAVVAGFLVIRNRLGLTLRWTISFAILRENFLYSVSNYIVGCLNLAPLLVIPILVLGELGPETAAAYFMAFQIAMVINSVSFAVGESSFAEGAHQEEAIRSLMARSAMVMAAVITPAVFVVVLLAGPALSLFGEAYAATAQSTLVVLAISSFAVAFHTWTAFLLKITDRLLVLIGSEVVFAVATTIFTVLAVSHGSVYVAAAWGTGNLLAGLVAGAALVTRRNGRGRATRRAASAREGVSARG
jgi:O-antigen/teichoic acid export membrane protein